ncbi:MAG: MurR/RpiR family transcriptional regulator [Clostridiales bacterium]|nr:MurR/RpiR family transcriptional regulator [Clostridiales bacterium]
MCVNQTKYPKRNEVFSMVSNILATIRSLYPALTPSGRHVADYVLAHGDEVIFMPITELAYRCSVSETSIMRFCRHVGMSGYQDFRLQLSSAIAQEAHLHPEANMELDETSQLIETIYSTFSTTIQGTKQLLRPENLRQVSKLINNAREVYFFGSRDSMALTCSACQTFMRTFSMGRSVQVGYTQELLLRNVSREDLVVFLSTRNTDEELYRLAEKAKYAGAKLVSISCCGPTSLSGLCNVNLFCGRMDPAAQNGANTGESSLNLASVSFLTELICATCRQTPDEPALPASVPQARPALPQTYYPDH